MKARASGTNFTLSLMTIIIFLVVITVCQNLVCQKMLRIYLWIIYRNFKNEIITDTHGKKRTLVIDILLYNTKTL